MRGPVMRRMIILTILLMIPLHAFGAEAPAMKYVLSIYADEKGSGLNKPEGIACSESRLVVADTGNGRIVLYSLQGGEPKGGTEIKLAQVLYPVRVMISSKGDLFVLDERQRKIARLTQEGVFTGYVEISGMPAPSTIVPQGIGFDSNDNLYVLDTLGGRVLVLAEDGKFQRQIELPKESGFITDLAVDPKGIIFLVDGAKSRVYSNALNQAAFSAITGELKDDIKFPSNVVIDTRGLLFISDKNSGSIVVMGKDGAFLSRLLSLGWTEGNVRYPSQICVEKDGSFFVADKENSRVQKFSPIIVK